MSFVITVSADFIFSYSVRCVECMRYWD